MSSVSVEDQIKEVFDLELPCEAYYHDRDSDFHEGPGEWYMQYGCQSCGREVFMLICDKFKQNIEVAQRMDAVFQCACGADYRTKTNIKLMPR